jgi:predicted nucleic acid-binding protein
VNALILDCSVAMAWCFEDEASPACDAILEKVRDIGAIVPALWYWEVGNVLVNAQRRSRISERDCTLRFDLLSALPISPDEIGTKKAWNQTRLLAQLHTLSVYDAAYLELALRTGGDLATLDKALRAAAVRSGVATLL